MSSIKKDPLGERMKNDYESRTRAYLPRRTYTIIRVDGKAFHTLTRNFERPFDEYFISLMTDTALGMCSEIQGVQFAYVQSDEISILLTDFETPKTASWFDGNIQKITSISASCATNEFFKARLARGDEDISEMIKKPALFDSRAFTIPQPIEVANYFIWRQADASRNSIQMLAQSLYSPKELSGKKLSEVHGMILRKGLNWNDLSIGKKRGHFIERVSVTNEDGLVRHPWRVTEPPIFTQDKEFLRTRIPKIPET